MRFDRKNGGICLRLYNAVDDADEALATFLLPVPGPGGQKQLHPSSPLLSSGDPLYKIRDSNLVKGSFGQIKFYRYGGSEGFPLVVIIMKQAESRYRDWPEAA